MKQLHFKPTSIGIILGAVLALLAVVFLAAITYYNHRSTSAEGLKPAVVARPELKPTAFSGYPVKLQIPALGMDLAVADGVYDQKTGAWSLSRDKVHYALMSVLPNNDTGNTLIYGHYRPEVFARLKSVKPGSRAVITTDNGYRFSYVFKSAKTVAPTDTSIFAYRGAPQLTLQTCTGIFMQDRQLFDFDFVSFEKT